MGKARDERDRREMVGSIRGDLRAMFARANVPLSHLACPVRFTLHALRLTVL